MKKYLIAGISAAALCAAAPAFAQDNSTAPKPADTMQNQPAQTPSATPSESAPAAKPSTDMKAPDATSAPSASDSAAAPSAEADKVTSADASGLRASTLIGSIVYNSADESIGDINDLIVGQDGQVEHVIVGVGGFLGMGERNVALKFSELDVRHDADNKLRVTSTLTKSDLEAMPEWKKPATRG